MLSSAWSKAYPTRHEHAQHVSVREQSDVAIKRARPANDPIRAGADLLRSLATGTSIAEYQPAGGDFSDLAGRQSLVCALCGPDLLGIEASDGMKSPCSWWFSSCWSPTLSRKRERERNPFARLGPLAGEGGRLQPAG